MLRRIRLSYTHMTFSTSYDSDSPLTADEQGMLAIVGANVRKARIAAKIEIDAIAEASEIESNRLMEIENAETEAMMTEVVRIAVALGVAPASLFDGIDTLR